MAQALIPAADPSVSQQSASRRLETVAGGAILVLVLALVVSACWIVLRYDWAEAKSVPAIAVEQPSLPARPIPRPATATVFVAELDAPLQDAVQTEVPVEQLRLREAEKEWKDVEAVLKGVPEIDAGQAILRAGTEEARLLFLHRSGNPAQREAWIKARNACIHERADCAGLPFRANVAHVDAEHGRRLAGLSASLRDYGVGDFGPDRCFNPLTLIENSNWRHEAAIPAIEQMLGAEEEAGRVALVRILARIGGSAASRALARRAIFDLSPAIRKEATRYLSRRPTEDYRDVLLDGLRYPWAVIASHAGEALVEVKDRKAVPALLAQLDRGDPAAPVRGDDGDWTRPQLVRVNHLRSCLLCHEPSLGPGTSPGAAVDRSLRATPSLDAPVPSTQQPLRRRRQYYESPRSPTGIFVRMDIVYLRQDFSVTQVVPPSKESFWPRLQRYDYFIRRKAMSEEEALAWIAKHPANESLHRKAVLAALRELTSVDAGDQADDWRAILATMRIGN
jgi:hypothetical protein